MKSAMRQPSLLDYGKLRGKSNTSQNILNSVALVTISFIDRAALAQRHDPGTEAFSKNGKRESEPHDLPRQLCGPTPTGRNAVPIQHYLCSTMRAVRSDVRQWQFHPTRDDGDSRVDVSIATKPLRMLTIGSVELNDAMASLRTIDSFSQVAIKL